MSVILAKKKRFYDLTRHFWHARYIMTNISICPLLSDIVKHWWLNWQRFCMCRFFGPSTTYLHKQTKEELQELVWFGQPSARWNDFDRVPCLRGWQFLGTSACFKQTGLSLLAPCQLEAMVIKVGLFSSLKYNPGVAKLTFYIPLLYSALVAGLYHIRSWLLRSIVAVCAVILE